jgi:hypothetical protein
MSIDTQIQTPLIYNQEKYPYYGVHKKTGEIYSKKRGSWKIKKFHVSGKSPYPSGTIMAMDGSIKFIQQHVAVHETLNPTLPIPAGITELAWKRTPLSVKSMLRKIWQVNHKDHNHLNYNPNNLEWTTGQENVNAYHRYRVAA